jgi:hypothetical protein
VIDCNKTILFPYENYNNCVTVWRGVIYMGEWQAV